MRIFFCLTLLLIAPMPAHAGALKQSDHQRFTFAEDYSGFYVKSYYFGNLDKVRFDACEGGGSVRCSTVVEISYTKLQSLKAPLLEMLRKYRAEVNEKKDSFWLFFSRAGMKSQDAEAIDRLIAEIEQDGPGHLVLLTEENIGKDPPTMTTPEFARELTARIKRVLESGPPMSDVDCIPYLRQQGL